ncbi:vWA domain-containing protein [Cerasicoccus arenae]|uniref:VWA domain-containing protein n=1 Tax=Cerasicoccus arenae TaxID=424488 RepID=A0A8J3DE87_9BACT|nr:VWA domain-containing protein [Cerasicoccus arenae]MBK1858367.1 VWA domain-containing protein [Cerasicoccus arenae]GHC09844.1 VWA domain-containing protein [Cerasicoccus arenae]
MNDLWSRITEVRFAYPWLLILWMAIPLVVYWAARHGPAGSITFSSTKILAGLAKQNRVSRGFFLRLLRMLGLALIVAACARPRIPQGEIPDSEKGIDVMLALDFSGSMDAEDYVVDGQKVSRLSALSSVIGEFVKGRKHDRFGIVGFAKYPYLTSPLTLDYDWITAALKSIKTEGGTAVGEGIHMSIKYLLSDELSRASKEVDEPEKVRETHWYDMFDMQEPFEIEGSRGPDKRQKVLIVISDGLSNTGMSPMDAAKIAKDEHIRIHTIRINPGVVHPSKVQKDVMFQIARETGGEFFQATNTATLLSIYQQIDRMEKTVIEQKRFQNFDEVFHWFAWGGVGLLTLEFLLWQTIKRRLP